jgi:hypothetical protein
MDYPATKNYKHSNKPRCSTETGQLIEGELQAFRTVSNPSSANRHALCNEKTRLSKKGKVTKRKLKKWISS